MTYAEIKRWRQWLMQENWAVNHKVHHCHVKIKAWKAAGDFSEMWASYPPGGLPR